MCLAVIGGIVSAAGTLASAAAASQSQKAQARLNERQARMETQKGAYEAARVSRANDRRLGSMRSAYLNSGIALEGSVADVIEESATEASLDEQAVKFGAGVRADNLRFEAQMNRMNARQAMVGGAIGALGSVVNGFTQMSQQNQMRSMIRNPYATGFA